MSSDWWNDFRQSDIRELSKFDGSLIEVRMHYERLSESERANMHQWLIQLVKACDALDAFLPVMFRAKIDNSHYDDEGEPTYEGMADITPRTLLRAVEAWQRGEEFTPKSHMSTLT